MDEDVLRLAVLGHLVRVKWRLLAVLAIIGCLVGFAVSPLLAPGFESASKVLLQEPRDKQAVLTEAQLAVSLVVLDRVAPDVGPGVTGADLVDRVSAEVVDGNIVRITGRGAGPEEARALTQQVTEQYVMFSAQVASDFVTAADDVRRDHRTEVQQRIDDAKGQIASLQNSPGSRDTGIEGAQIRANIEQLSSTISDAQGELDDIDARSSGSEADAKVARASINIIEPAVLPLARTAPTPVQLTAAGGVLFVLLGLLALLVARRRDARLRRSADIGAALGAPVVCSVDVPDQALVAPAQDEEPRSRTLADRILREDVQRAVLRAAPVGVRDPVAPFRRALGKFRGAPNRPPRLMVLVPDGDAAARRVAAALVLATGSAGSGVDVVTEDEPFARLVERVTGAEGPGADRVTVADPTAQPRDGRGFVRVVGVATGRPAVPDDPHTVGSVVVVTAGTRTGWELVALSEACADAGRSLDAAVVVAGSATRAEFVAVPPQALPPEPPGGNPRAELNGHAMAVTE